MHKNPDRRLSISIDPVIADRLDACVAQNPETNRSRVIEEAVKFWLWDILAQYEDKEKVLKEAMKLYEEQQERELYRAYFAELSQKERAEIDTWTALSEDSADKHWEPFKK